MNFVPNNTSNPEMIVSDEAQVLTFELPNEPADIDQCNYSHTSKLCNSGIFTIGREFDSYEEFVQALKLFEAKTCSRYCILNSSRAEKVNPKRKKHIVPLEFKIARAHYVCTHYGTAKLRINKHKKEQKTCKIGCQAYFIVAYDDTVNKLMITRCRLNHNHTTNVATYIREFKTRKLTEEQKEVLKPLMVPETSNIYLQKLIRSQFQKELTLPEVRRLKYQFKQVSSKSNEPVAAATRNDLKSFLENKEIKSSYIKVEPETSGIHFESKYVTQTTNLPSEPVGLFSTTSESSIKQECSSPSNFHVEPEMSHDTSHDMMEGSDNSFVKESIESDGEPLDSEEILMTKPTSATSHYHQQSKRMSSNREDILRLTCEELKKISTPDQYDIFGKHIAHKLKNMPLDQRIHAQKLINDVIYEGELSSLSRASHVVSSSTVFDPSNIQQIGNLGNSDINITIFEDSDEFNSGNSFHNNQKRISSLFNSSNISKL